MTHGLPACWPFEVDYSRQPPGSDVVGFIASVVSTTQQHEMLISALLCICKCAQGNTPILYDDNERTYSPTSCAYSRLFHERQRIKPVVNRSSGQLTRGEYQPILVWKTHCFKTPDPLGTCSYVQKHNKLTFQFPSQRYLPLI
jgi:hypothetical protein